MTHATELRVRYAETDRMGIVYYANYLVWCEVGRVEFMRALGGSYAELEAQGYGLAVAEASVRYLSPARFDDLVRVETSLVEVRSRAVTFDYRISNVDTGVRLATAHTALVSIDSTGRPVALPPEFRQRLDGAR
jgi:acyl-CoA thioester hydrolase